MELSLAATHTNWRLFMVRKADPAFLAFQKKVFTRDEDTCQFCGFKAKSFMDVVNVDGNFYNNHINNLVTACCFCSQCYFLESVGRDEIGGGTLISFPELSQIELNALCHELFVSIIGGTTAAGQARNIYRSIKLRSQQAEKLLGEGMSTPSMLGRLLVDSGDEQSSDFLHNIKDSIRLLPDMQKFANPVRVWVEEAYDALCDAAA